MGELCPQGRLLGLSRARQNQVWCQRGWRPGILQDHIAPSLTVPQFFSLPSLLGSAERALSWCPPYRESGKGYCYSPDSECKVPDSGLRGDRGGTHMDVGCAAVSGAQEEASPEQRLQGPPGST